MAVGYVIESYGLITNKTLLEKAGYTTDDIKSFADLKVAEDITARRTNLALAHSPPPVWILPLTGASRPTWPTCPSDFEYQADGIGYTDAIKGTYLDNYKDMFDLYINNSTCMLLLSWLARLAMTAATSSWTMRLSSSRTVLGIYQPRWRWQTLHR